MKFKLIVFMLIVTLSLSCGGQAGSKVAFVKGELGKENIYQVDSDGKKERAITGHYASDISPCWSSNDKKLAYSSTRHEEQSKNYEVYTLEQSRYSSGASHSYGTRQKRLTHLSPGEVLLSSRCWSPNDNKIIFSSDNTIYIMDVDGSKQESLASGESQGGSYPVWSPDGEKIVFKSYRDGNSEVYIMNSDGSQHTRLTQNNVDDHCESWSPNGEKLACVAKEMGRSRISIINSDGTQQHFLTKEDSETNESFPLWSPDGERILYTSWNENQEDSQLLIMDVDGSNKDVFLSESNTRGGAWSSK